MDPGIPVDFIERWSRSQRVAKKTLADIRTKHEFPGHVPCRDHGPWTAPLRTGASAESVPGCFRVASLYRSAVRRKAQVGSLREAEHESQPRGGKTKSALWVLKSRNALRCPYERSAQGQHTNSWRCAQELSKLSLGPGVDTAERTNFE
jgi:hypothetical protein